MVTKCCPLALRLVSGIQMATEVVARDSVQAALLGGPSWAGAIRSSSVGLRSGTVRDVLCVYLTSLVICCGWLVKGVQDTSRAGPRHYLVMCHYQGLVCPQCVGGEGGCLERCKGHVVCSLNRAPLHVQTPFNWTPIIQTG